MPALHSRWPAAAAAMHGHAGWHWHAYAPYDVEHINWPCLTAKLQVQHCAAHAHASLQACFRNWVTWMGKPIGKRWLQTMR